MNAAQAENEVAVMPVEAVVEEEGIRIATHLRCWMTRMMEMGVAEEEVRDIPLVLAPPVGVEVDSLPFAVIIIPLARPFKPRTVPFIVRLRVGTNQRGVALLTLLRGCPLPVATVVLNVEEGLMRNTVIEMMIIVITDGNCRGVRRRGCQGIDLGVVMRGWDTAVVKVWGMEAQVQRSYVTPGRSYFHCVAGAMKNLHSV